MDTPIAPTPRLLRIGEVMDRVGLSRASIYRYAKAGTFPAPRRIGERSVGWLEADIVNWILQR